MKILVTGAGGLLGSTVALMASQRHEVIATFSRHPPTSGKAMELDLTDSDRTKVVVAKEEPDAIVHAAALTDVDRCEREHDLAERVNHEATRILSESARKLGAYFLYVSTDYVFDGERGNYKEDDQVNPISFYGLTKLRGEQAVEASGAESCIARASAVYGSRPAAGKVNFALWLIESLRNGERVQAPRDQYLSPTLNSNLARMITEALERGLTGTFHTAGASRVNRYEFALALARSFDLDGSLIAPAQMGDMRWLAKRPRDSSLNVSKATSVLKVKPLLLAEAMLDLRRAVADSSDKK